MTALPADVLDGSATWALVEGDCLSPVLGLASLPDGCAAHVITDPPYSEHTHNCSRSGRRSHPNESFGACARRNVDLGFACLTQDTLEAVADQATRLVLRWQLYFCDVESSHLWAGAIDSTDGAARYLRTCAWIKVGGTPQFTGDRPAVGFEAIVCGHRPGKMRWNGGGKAGVYSVPIVLDRGGNLKEHRCHPTQKPLDLMLALVSDFTDPGDVVLDPFAGSGTTGVACLRLGRRFIGWERDPKHFATACKRLAGTREQLGLPLRRPREKQQSLFLTRKATP